ncbi:MAG: class I mannose-6-phosphate isomerase [Verrucomicrobia bacterium]|nr:class I mannose-6-phosphate isomerase [Verrucomicrobiota bacterium]
MQPITFQPLYMNRVWGGRSLETLYHRALPDAQPYGESWELTDRPDEQSVVLDGPFAGQTLHELWTDYREDLFGTGLEGDRFPLLIKILDAHHDLSLQVHPPAALAEQLHGEPKTEMWFIAHAAPGAKLYLGLKDGTTRYQFEAALADGTVADLVHAVIPQVGDSILIPSGRLHAIGAGLLIYEIQQNSDTTYRVFDWNRLGLNGQPRPLHVAQSLQCIDFTDHQPSLDTPHGNTLATCPFFQVDHLTLPLGDTIDNTAFDRFSILTVITGELQSLEGHTFLPGDFLLLPRGAFPLTATAQTTLLQTTIPKT